MRRAFVMPMVLVITLLISALIGSFMVNSSTSLSHQFYRDLAEIRGYWASYGAKELNISSISYSYNHYSIDVERIDNYSWEWNLSIPAGESSGIDSGDIYTRKIELNSSDPNRVKSYSN